MMVMMLAVMAMVPDTGKRRCSNRKKQQQSKDLLHAKNLA